MIPIKGSSPDEKKMLFRFGAVKCLQEIANLITIRLPSWADWNQRPIPIAWVVKFLTEEGQFSQLKKGH
jgi:hypothetical protein